MVQQNSPSTHAVHMLRGCCCSGRTLISAGTLQCINTACLGRARQYMQCAAAGAVMELCGCTSNFALA
jgi:hypothetical protein